MRKIYNLLKKKEKPLKESDIPRLSVAEIKNEKLTTQMKVNQLKFLTYLAPLTFLIGTGD